MRFNEFILEKIGQNGASLLTLKKEIKSSVDQTDDTSLLNKIYSALNSTNISQRIAKGLSSAHDKEINAYLESIAKIIVDLPHSYNEKIAFAAGLKDGYVDVATMLDGERHHFADLLIPRKGVNKQFLLDLFNELKLVGENQAKGPGEFSLAILSPTISIWGEGDLKIGKQKVEVKADKGRLGTTGFLQHERVPEIIQKYFPNITSEKTLGLTEFAKLVQQKKLPPEKLKQFATELFGYIFEGKPWAEIDTLVSAMSNTKSGSYATDIGRAYTLTAYKAYRGENQQKFEGVMLMNFKNQELQYYTDPEKMFNDLNALSLNFITKNPDFRGRLNLPGLDLSRQQLQKPDFRITKKTIDQEANTKLADMAEFLVKSAQQHSPRDLSLRDTKLVSTVVKFMQDLWLKRTPPSSILPMTKAKFPQLKTRVVAPAEIKPVVKKRTPKDQTNPPSNLR